MLPLSVVGIPVHSKLAEHESLQKSKRIVFWKSAHLRKSGRFLNRFFLSVISVFWDRLYNRQKPVFLKNRFFRKKAITKTGNSKTTKNRFKKTDFKNRYTGSDRWSTRLRRVDVSSFLTRLFAPFTS